MQNQAGRGLSVIDIDPTSPTFHSVLAAVPVEGRPFAVVFARAPGP